LFFGTRSLLQRLPAVVWVFLEVLELRSVLQHPLLSVVLPIKDYSDEGLMLCRRIRLRKRGIGRVVNREHQGWVDFVAHSFDCRNGPDSFNPGERVHQKTDFIEHIYRTGIAHAPQQKQEQLFYGVRHGGHKSEGEPREHPFIEWQKNQQKRADQPAYRQLECMLGAVIHT